MNHAKKLQLLAVLGVLTISSASLVQAADIPVVSSGGATYNIGLQGWSSFTNSDNVKLGRLIAIPIPMQGIQMQRVIILPSVVLP